MTGILVIIHNGSYMPHIDRHECSTAFIIYCTRTKLTSKGTRVEKCADANNYYAEILGGIVVQLILLEASQKLLGPYHTTSIDCSNWGLAQYRNTPSVFLKEKQLQEDVLWILKHIIGKHYFVVDYQWVPSH